MFRRLRARDLHDVEGADEIGVDIGARIFEAVANPRLRREMDDHVDGMLFGDLLQRRHIFEHLDIFDEMVRAAQNFVPCALQGDIVIGRHAVDADDVMSLREQPPREMKADETRGACNQETHFHSPGAPPSASRR